MLFLAIEFLDEFVYGTREAALPLIRDALHLSYAQVGLLLGLPGFVSAVLEPVIDLVADSGNRLRRTTALILGGGIVYALSLFLTGASQRFGLLLVSYALFWPASGAFVSLSQGCLMDLYPAQREQNMARWNFTGSVGVLLGSLAVAATLNLGISWRWLFYASTLLTFALLVVARRNPNSANSDSGDTADFWQSVKLALNHLREWQITRWLVFLQISDLVLAVFVSYTSLYFVDVLGASPEFAALVVMLSSGIAMAGDFLVIRILKRVPGLRYMRYTAWMQVLLIPLFLLMRVLWVNLALLILITLFCSGWYAILKAQLYEALPEKGGTVMALNNIGGLVGAVIPWFIGLAAARWGLAFSLWIVLFAPVVFLFALPETPENATRGGF